MRDDFLSREWADTHSEMSNGIGKLFRTISDSFEKLNAIQYDAPWRHHKSEKNYS